MKLFLCLCLLVSSYLVADQVYRRDIYPIKDYQVLSELYLCENYYVYLYCHTVTHDYLCCLVKERECGKIKILGILGRKETVMFFPFLEKKEKEIMEEVLLESPDVFD